MRVKGGGDKSTKNKKTNKPNDNQISQIPKGGNQTVREKNEE